MKTADLPIYYNMCQILEDNLKSRANQVALLSKQRVMTFNEVSRQVNQIGNAFKRSGIQFGHCVAILSPDRPEWITTFFATAKIGGISLGLNTLLKTEDYDYILKDANVRLLVVHHSLLASVEPILHNQVSLTKVVVIGNHESDNYTKFIDWIAAEDTNLVSQQTHREDFCSLHYSSGTTGIPKGIYHAHKDYPLIAQLSGVELFGVNKNDRTFSVAKLFFVYGIGGNLIFPWFVGASCVLFDGEPRQAGSVLKIIDKFKPTVFVSVPTVYGAILSLPNFNERYDVSSIRLCISAGESLPARLWHAWKNITGLEILDTIGCTETYHTFMANRPGEVRPGSSGKPIKGYDVRLVDDKGADVPPGTIGNLMVRGETTALFYLHQSEKARQTFRGEWLLTGDRYLQDKNGYYWNQGRADDMLKVGGLWVSPSTIEEVIIGHELVNDCAVVGCNDEAGLIKPKAFVCLQAGVTPSDEILVQLLKLCANTLDTHSRPRWLEFIDDLPRTATGKLQRFKLREH